MKTEIKRLKLKNLSNTRDLGGLPTEDGRTVRCGKLIRSGRLYKLPEKTKRALQDMGVKTVIDLRTDIEQADYPYDPLYDCEYICAPLLCNATVGITREKTSGRFLRKGLSKILREEGKRIKENYGGIDGYMMAMYENFALLPQSQESTEKFLRLLIEKDGCVLWNCSAGKDRTGYCAMIVESLLGCSRETVLLDYTASYTLVRKKRRFQRFAMWVVPFPPTFRTLLVAMMYAKPEYIMAAINAIEKNYGSIYEYCKTALHITDEDIQILKEKYLE